jgi:membrane peptidoglycan carboxypeptidase
MAAAVWVGDPKQLRSLNGLTIGGRTYGSVFGATIAGPIWRDTLQAALEGEPVEPLPAADPTYVHGITKPIPYVVGLNVADATKVLKAADFTVAVSSHEVDSDLPKGTVAATSPASSAPPGSTITPILSNGHPPRAVRPAPTGSASPPASNSPSPAATKTHGPKPHGHGPPPPH